MLATIEASILEYLDGRIQPGTILPISIPYMSLESSLEWRGRIESLIHEADAIHGDLICAAALAAFCFEIRTVWFPGPDFRRADQAPLFRTEAQSYTFWDSVNGFDSDKIDLFGSRKLTEDVARKYEQRVVDVLQAYGSEASRLQELGVVSKSAIDDIISSAETRISSIVSAAADLDENVTMANTTLTQLRSDFNVSKGSHEAFVTAVREELKISESKQLWKSRANWSAASFWLSGAVIAAAIGIPTYYTITHVEGVANLLRTISNAAVQGLPDNATAAQLTAATISRLVIVSAPLALYFWAIKLMVRFNTRSMVLMDDARQRHTTMDTYFHLIEQNGATTEERALMLNALFRPLPGQGGENIEPPNFYEIVGKTKAD